MRISFATIDAQCLVIIKKVGQLADSQGIRAYLVGGFVRDIVLKRRNLDVDIVVEGDAIKLAMQLAVKEHAPLMTYPPFKTATVLFKNGVRLDLTTARKERYPYPGALPVVEKGTIRDDLFRRDFTINATAAVINKEDFGSVVDYFAGLADIKAKKVRVLHDQSFIDDPTRILRAVRFEQRFGFCLEPKTLRLLQGALKKDAVKTVKPARHFEEFKKILNEAYPRKSLERLSQLQGLKFLDHNLRLDLKQLDQWPKQKVALDKKIGEAVAWWVVYFMAVAARIKKERLKPRIEQWSLTRKDIQSILAVYEAEKTIGQLNKIKIRASGVYRLLKPLSLETIIYLRLIASKPAVQKRIDRFLIKDRFVKLNVNGEDLKKLGIETGQKMGFVLNAILCRKIDGGLKSRANELSEAKRLKDLSLLEVIAHQTS